MALFTSPLTFNMLKQTTTGAFMTTEKMSCPRCGTPMNHHADKPDRTATVTESETVDPELAGIIEIHACPGCGNTEVRKAS
jgi:exosome complex RNA-binding protein Csl4